MFSVSKNAWTPPQLFLTILACGPLRLVFRWKVFSLKYMLFDSVFYADSEDHMHLARKLNSDSQIREIPLKSVAFFHR